MMLPALQLSLNGFKLRDHPLLRRNPPNDESSAAVELPTEVSETQEREGLQSDRTKSASGLEDCANHLLTAFAHPLERITSGGARHPSSLN